MAEPMTVEELRKAQADEYSVFVATEAIMHDGVLAYGIGYPVPKSNVERHGYDKQGLVSKVGTKAAATATATAVNSTGA